MYDRIFNELQNRVYNGKLTLEQASQVNDLAYKKYIMEGFFFKKKEIKPEKELTPEEKLALAKKKMEERDKKIDENLNKANAVANKFANNTKKKILQPKPSVV